MQESEASKRWSGRLVGLLDPSDPRLTDDRLAPILRDFLEQYDSVLDELDDEEVLRSLAEDLLTTFNLFLKRKKEEILVHLSVAGDPGPKTSTSFIDVVCKDQPFIVDSLEMILDEFQLEVINKHTASAPVVRDRDGTIQAIDGTAAKAKDEIICHFEISEISDPTVQEQLLEMIRKRLDMAAKTVLDFKRMKGVLRDSIRSIRRSAAGDPDGDYNQTRNLLEWLLQDHFVLFGVKRWACSQESLTALEEDLSLGIPCPDSKDDEVVRLAIEQLGSGHPPVDRLVSFKGMAESVIHRQGKIDHIVFMEPGGLSSTRFVHVWGLFTFKAVQTPGDQIPHVRNKFEHVISQHSFPRGGMRYKAYQNSFNSIPVEFLFQAKASEIDAVIQAIHFVERSKEIRGHLVIDDERRKGLYFLITPRDGYSEEQRSSIEEILFELMGASYSDSRVKLGKHGTVLLSFYFTATDKLHEISAEQIEEKVRLVAGSWSDRLHRQLHLDKDTEADSLFRSYRDAFPKGYQISHSPDEALQDIEKLEQIRLADEAGMAFSVSRSEIDRERSSARLRIYQRKNLFLSTTLPILGNFGLEIVDQNAFQVSPPTGEKLTIDTFQVHGVTSDDHPLMERSQLVVDALESIFNGSSSSDLLDKLVLEVGVGHLDVDLIRNQLHFLHQLGISTTIAFASGTLCQHGAITRKLLEYYHVRFDPDLDLGMKERKAKAAEIRREILRALNSVRSSAQDIFIRRLFGILESTLRTTRFHHSRDPLQAYKYDSVSLPVGNHPRPWREIFVHHPEVEGVHLRGGPLARGGLRWSDRTTDYRTEVHGLQRTQMVKNVLIVPVGAKGGFVLRKPEPDRGERREQADRLYRVFVEGLLRLTDNVVDHQVIPPDRTVRWDGDDPYLVVAADKGTAHLSNTANEISREHGFWLGDAFASGGSNGYDHKKLAITARGSWEQAKLHFRNLAIDFENQPYSVVGIGDMSGDVFGNGMLLAQNAKLIAAFNHLDIFIDPDPDLEKSAKERERLFKLKRSSWRDFDPALISAGGGVYDRSDKKISPSHVARVLLGLPSTGEFSPEEVIRAILGAQVDMIYNGGIGTFIRSSQENDRDVDDAANSACRIAANAVRARMIIEGGNLGVTPKGRVELARGGTQINTDFIDNSGGVDCSDHEVNLKTLLHDVVRSGEITLEERNQILIDVQDDVCEQVLDNTREQGLLLGLDEVRGNSDPFSIERTMMLLEDRGVLDREAESLPSHEELATRHAAGGGLTRPELAIVAAHAKMDVYRRLLKQPEGRVDENRLLFEYFPERIREQFPDSIRKHQLRREIAMTVLTNRIVDRAGSSFCLDMERETGRSIGHVARSYLMADDLIGAEEMRTKILALKNIPSEVVYTSLVKIEEALRRTAAWLLATNDDDRLDRIDSLIAEGVRPLQEYEDSIPGCLAGPELERHENHLQETIELGISETLAQRIIKFEYLTAGVRILDISRSFDIRVPDVARLYYYLGNHSGLHPLVRKCDVADFSGRWDSLSMRILRNTILDGLWALVARICDKAPKEREEGWIEQMVEDLRRKPSFKAMESDIRRIGSEELSIASVQVLSVRFRRYVQ
ncbi:MAG: NAD-glutamate dehydrogenase domain-containing protein [Planctomycetota bacterium]|nr:NAD-glutamate dehydrogenase domain-containing protein [Planctomycetota bacterium]